MAQFFQLLCFTIDRMFVNAPAIGVKLELPLLGALGGKSVGEFCQITKTDPATDLARPAPVLFLFPGQSSADPGMIARARSAHPAAQVVADVAQSVLGKRAADRLLGGAEIPLQSNRDVQVGVFLATQMYLAALVAEGISAAHSLGSSLGEYSHLVDIGALELAQALALVDERGRCYDCAQPGIMAAVMAVELLDVEAVISAAQARGEPIFISNYNGPTQNVIAGTTAAVMAVIEELEDEHFGQTVIIEDRVPMHTMLMSSASEEFAKALASVDWRRASRDYHPNVTAEPIQSPGPDDYAAMLRRHVCEPVMWHRSIVEAVRLYPEAALLEVGPGRVLQNQIKRVWRSKTCHRTDALGVTDCALFMHASVGQLHVGS